MSAAAYIVEINVWSRADLGGGSLESNGKRDSKIKAPNL